MKLNEDFRYRFKNGSEFSGRDSGFLVVENLELPRKGDLSRLQLSQHVDFICSILQLNQERCFWLVESPSHGALEDLRSIFADHHVLNGSLIGYFEFDRQLITRFWTAFEAADKTEPWKNEASWALGSVSNHFPLPQSDLLLQRPYWSVEHILRNCEKVKSIFVQAECFAFFAVRPLDGVRALVEKEFPQLT